MTFPNTIIGFVGFIFGLLALLVFIGIVVRIICDQIFKSFYRAKLEFITREHAYIEYLENEREKENEDGSQE